MKAFAIALLVFGAAQAQMHWVGTWATAPSPVGTAEQMKALKLEFNNQTVREIVHTTIGGSTVRVKLSNVYGTAPVKIGSVRVGDRSLTFSGRTEFEMPANADFLSDPLKFTVPEAGDLAISIYLPGPTPAAAVHYAASQTSFVGTEKISSWVFLTGVDVLAPESIGSIVAFGDSITDGAKSSPDTNSRWPDVLARRLLAQKGKRYSVVNMGIGANRLLHDGIAGNARAGENALARFERDVLAQPGVKYVIVLEGINDIGHPGSSAPAEEAVTAEDIISAYRQMIERAHEHGIQVIGATITPFEGEAQSSRGYYTAKKEKIRTMVNAWIRSGTAFDGFVDFDAAVRDPAHPARMLPAFDSGDNLHPSDGGYRTLGSAIDLGLFKNGRSVTGSVR